MRLLPRAALRARMELRYYKFCNIHFILLTAELRILLAIKNNEYIFALPSWCPCENSVSLDIVIHGSHLSDNIREILQRLYFFRSIFL